tara:strand:- start:25994 stop:27277 length:1284 start_codon:yes stop_codon:yes gene_type:complete
MNKIIILIVLVLQSIQLSAEIDVVDRIAIIVDDGIIMESEVNSALESTIKNIQSSNDQMPPKKIIFERVLERLIIDEILLQKAKKFGVRISDQELNESLNRYAAQDNLTLQELKEKIESDNQSFKDFREALKREMILRRVQNGLVRPKIFISDQELENYINSTEGENLISIEYKINQILLKIPSGASKEEVSKIEKLSLEVYEKITKGETSFLDSINNHSDLKDMENLGSLGWRKKSEIPTLFVNLIPEMQKNDVRGPIRSGAGFHIIELEDIRGDTIKSESQTLVQHVLIQESEIRSENQAKNLINELHARVSSGEDLGIIARVYSDDPGSKLDGGKLDWSSDGVYDKPFEKVMNEMKIGEVSKPFESAFGWHILKVLDRREKNVSDELLKDKAYRILFNRKYSEQLQNTLKEMRSEAFIDIKISS